jgi:hypothetical protein
MTLNYHIQHVTVALSRLLVIFLLSCAPAYAAPLDLKTVFENVAVTAPARVAFREERHNPMLKKPIVLTGYLEYLKPGHLRKVIETPFKESFLIADDQIEINRDGKVRKLSLSKSKPIRAMLGGIEAILAGQTDKVDEMFHYELTGTSHAWSLRLEPRSVKISSHLTSMLVEGDELVLSSIRVDMQKGEWSLMDILQPDADP